VHRLRQVLPDGAELVFEGSHLRLGPEFALVSESARVEQLLARAARMHGDERLELLLEALASLDKGEYMGGVHSRWVDARRERLALLAADARHQAAEMSFAAGQHPEAERLAGAVLRADPYREGTWRLLMKIAHAMGDDDRVIATFRLCERAMTQIGTVPSASTRDLLGTLRG
jgi:DNA-binding SARP family transcriptional activator